MRGGSSSRILFIWKSWGEKHVPVVILGELDERGCLSRSNFKVKRPALTLVSAVTNKVPSLFYVSYMKCFDFWLIKIRSTFPTFQRCQSRLTLRLTIALVFENSYGTIRLEVCLTFFSDKLQFELKESLYTHVSISILYVVSLHISPIARQISQNK